MRTLTQIQQLQFATPIQNYDFDQIGSIIYENVEK